ncbi:hypothetical protein K7432_003305 [Basidiobolus ranarum]|uniref:RNA-dependent RNA polymerase n=1 Tax=Basidiobolus ranarum TaxID=34480 RepID=A0ABR2W6S4_9FUNG
MSRSRRSQGYQRYIDEDDFRSFRDNFKPQSHNRGFNSRGRYPPPFSQQHLPPISDEKLRCLLELRINLRNVCFSATAAEVKSFLSQFGHVEVCSIDKDEYTERPLGTGYVIFKPPPEKLTFLSMNHVFKRRALILELPEPEKYQRRSHSNETFKADVLQFGFLVGPTKYLTEWELKENVNLSIDYTIRTINLQFDVRGREYKLTSNFKEVEHEIAVQDNSNQLILTMAFNYPPRFWIKDDKHVGKDRFYWSTHDCWKRITKLWMVPVTMEMASSKEPATIYYPDEAVQLGNWRIYRLHFNGASQSRIRRELGNFITKASKYNLIKKRSLFNSVEIANKDEYTRSRVDITALPFEIQYMIECLLSHDVINEYSVNQDFVDLLSDMSPRIALATLELMHGLKKPIYNIMKSMMKQTQNLNQIYRTTGKVAQHAIMIRKVTITPTKIYIEPPSIETSNRVIRHFSNERENFLRINFSEEGFLKIGVNTTTLGQVYSRLYNVLVHGLVIGNKHYEFLAFSSSQLREHGCWFFASTEKVTAHSIRHWMGDFRSIKNIAKYASRMGQCFSSTRAIAMQPVKDIRMIPDIVRNGYTFSDGVGKVSIALCKKIAKTLDLDHVPPVFQFRLGGCKGVLALSPFVRGDQIQIRPSQIKFESHHNILEIVKVSTYIPCYLNRQIITLLSSLGVPDQVFLNLQQHMIKQLKTISTDDATAIKVLTQNTDEYGITRRMIELIKAGHRTRQDPFIVNLLTLFQVSLLKDIKTRARIHVSKGCFLMGVLDETMSLQENQIFVQYSDPENPNRRKVIVGTCIVTRNPCFHPGDIRVVQAVNIKGLSHLYDCVAFSALGFRDTPSQCSGGDLDGDFFTVIWDPNLIPPTKNYSPMEYDPPGPVEVDEVQIDHIKKFFVNYIASDNLGQISNAHLVHADKHPDGAFNGICLRLAQLNSRAVDFPKTGVPAEFEPGLKVKEYPDFMEKPEGIPTYNSTRIQGKMYRSITTQKFVLAPPVGLDERLLVPGYEEYLEDARNQKASYDMTLFGILKQYGIPTEYEVISGFMDKWVILLGRRKHSVRERVMDSYMAVRSAYIHQFEEEFYDKSTQLIPYDAKEAIYKKASAWYYTTYSPDEGNKNSAIPTFYSFPWVVDRYLNEIALNHHHLSQTKPKPKPSISLSGQTYLLTSESKDSTGNQLNETVEVADIEGMDISEASQVSDMELSNDLVSDSTRFKQFDINDEEDDLEEFAMDFL